MSQSWAKRAASSSGVAEITDLQGGNTVQISCVPISGSSIVTVTVKPALAGAYQSVVDGTIDLAAPQTCLLEGRIEAIKATAANSGDSFDLIVVS